MNDRIKQIAEEVYGSLHHDDIVFAKRIIEECKQALENNKSNLMIDDWAEAQEEIDDHFGFGVE